MAESNRFEDNPLYPLLSQKHFDNIGDDWQNQPSIVGPLLSPEQLAHLESQRIRNVQLEQKLGDGVQGQVYSISADFNINCESGEQPEWQRMRFAIKVIHHRSRYRIDHNLNEIRVLSRLRHENIANMIEFFGIPDRITGFPFSVVCMVSELCDEPLMVLRWKNRNGLSENLNRHWFAQCVRGLNYLHSNGIIHQDIHDGNILIRKGSAVRSVLYEDSFLPWTFKLADFGASNQFVANQPSSNPNATFQRDINGLIILLKFLIQKYSASEPLKEMIGTTFDRIIDLLLHPWLQLNAEPRTEPYILRQNLEIIHQPDYVNWESYRSNPDPNYAPFGTGPGQRQAKMPLTQWTTAAVPLQGVPYFPE